MVLYKINDYIICRSGGVWCISRIDDRGYTLVEHEAGMEKTIPEGSDEIVRKIASKDTTLDAISRVGYIRKIQMPNDKICKELYDEAMAKFDEIEWIKVIKTVYLRQQEKRLTPYEITCYEKAKGFFHGEVSVILGIPVSKVEDYIAAAVSNDSW